VFLETKIYLKVHFTTAEISTSEALHICIQGGPKKTAQSLWHHNFATVHHRVMWFSAKCSEKNSLHD